MVLDHLLSADRIAILAEPGDRDVVLDAAARLLGNAAPGATAAIGASLRSREQLAATAIGDGVAIPHGRCAAVSEVRAAFLRLSRPVDFGAGDGRPVDLVLALAVPEQQVQQHLELLAELATQFGDPAFRGCLRNAPDLGELRRFLLDGSRHQVFRGAVA
ncbi:MAG TPA: PTS sugar transporter subunit IIA [Lysobacter sp.]